MADALNSVGSIATFIFNNLNYVPTGISGNLVIIADSARQYVANYAGVTIGSNSISDKFQGAIVDFAMADTVDLLLAQAGGEQISLGELSINDSGEVMSSQQYRLMGEMKLKAIGKKTQFARSLS